MTLSRVDHQVVEAGLRCCRFRAGRSGLHRGPLHVSLGDSWSTFWMRGGKSVGDQDGGPGMPGLWRRVTSRDSPVPRLEFDVPTGSLVDAALAGGQQDPREQAAPPPLAALVQWVCSCRDGSVDTQWKPPEQESTRAELAPGNLALQSGPLLLQGSVIQAPGRFALRFPLAVFRLEALDPCREQWLEESVRASTRQWRMVRVGREKRPESVLTLLVEVDLSGCPHGLFDSLVRSGVAAARWVASWLLWPVRSLTDPDLAGEVWDHLTERVQPAERRSPSCPMDP